jgi:hypothetical protein
MAAIIAAALALWGIVIPLRVEFFENDIGILAQSCGPNGLIGVYRPGWEQLSEADRVSLIAHEAGHCLGLGHYGSCNHNHAIMGCWNLGEVTGYDRAMLAGHRVVVPMVGN